MYTAPSFSKDVDISKNKVRNSIEQLLNGVIHGKIAQSYHKGYENYSPADLGRAMVGMHFHEKEQQVFRDLLLGTFLKIENMHSGSGFVFLSAIVELMKLHDAYFVIEKEKIRKSINHVLLQSRRATFDDYQKFITWYFKNSLVKDILSQAITLSGNVGSIFVKEQPAVENSIEIKTGYTFELAVSQIYAESIKFQNWKSHDVQIVVIDGMIEKVSEIHNLLTEFAQPKRPCAIFARGFNPDVCSTLAMNNMRGTLDVIPIEVPYDLLGANLLNDIALVAGTDIRSSLKGELISTMNLEDLGFVSHVTIENNRVTIEDNMHIKRIQRHIAFLKKKMLQEIVQEKKDIFSTRIRGLSPVQVNISLSRELGEAHGMYVDRVNAGCLTLKNICNNGIINFTDLLKDPMLNSNREYLFLRNLLKSLKKSGVEYFGTGAFFHGINAAISLEKEIRNCHTIVRKIH